MSVAASIHRLLRRVNPPNRLVNMECYSDSLYSFKSLILVGKEVGGLDSSYMLKYMKRLVRTD
jgi:hypothetical protein